NFGHLEQRLDLGGEVERVADEGIVERADAKTVAAKHEALVVAIPEREGILAVEAREAFGAVLFVKVDEHLAVGASAEAMSLGDQFLAQLDVVEDLAVGDDPDRFVLVRQRLKTTSHVNDRETCVAEMYPLSFVEASA